ncbi:GNAT family N-acetyltransferase [Arthrobacter sp. NPDC090010]|uniref:GNAT family N-acetyltransferase n=1 Tax=Arthrobacter sp. NPDC090010 TaxID=3363942 RepID=UPI003817C382
MITVREPYDGEWGPLARVAGYAGMDEAELSALGVGDVRLGSAVPRRALGVKAFRKALLKDHGTLGVSGTPLMLSSTVLIAVTTTNRVAGVGVVSPDVQEIQSVAARGGAQEPIFTLRGLANIHRLRGVGVDPDFRGRGVGRALLNALVWHYRLSGMSLLQGRLPAGSGKEVRGFLRGSGFRVTAPGVSLDISRIFGIPAVLAPAPGERLFYQGLQNPGADDWELPGLMGDAGGDAGSAAS